MPAKEAFWFASDDRGTAHPKTFTRSLTGRRLTGAESVLRDSPVDFETAVAYALQPDMRRLIIVYLLGGVLTTFGLSLFVEPGFVSLPVELVASIVALVVAVVGAAMLFGGLIGAAFKVVTDANRLATAE